MAVVHFDKDTDDSLNGHKVLRFLKESCIGSLRELSCTQVLTDQLVSQFSSCFQGDSNLHLESLKLRKNDLTMEAAPAIAQILRLTAATLHELDLAENQIKGSGLQALVGTLTSPSCKLRKLNLSNNKLDMGKESASALTALARDNTSIETLRLGYNNLRSKRIKAISKGLCEAIDSQIRHLDLTQNSLEDRGAHAMAENLSSRNCRLESLNLCQNKIRYKGAYHLADAFVQAKNTSLKRLDLSNNFIGQEGAEAFGVVLRFSYTLYELNLSRNNIGDEGVEVIARGLRENADTQLRRLDLSWNGIKDDGARNLSYMLRDNSVLAYLNLKSNFICDPGVKALALSLPYSMVLEELDLTGNQMRDPGPLVEALCHHDTKLQRLHYEQNHLSSQALAQIKAAFVFRDNKRGWLGKLLRDIKEKTQIKIDLQRRKHSDEEIVCLSKQLAKYHCKVITAEFGGPSVTSKGMATLSSNVISTNAACLQRLYIRNAKRVGDMGTVALARGLASNHTIRCVCLTNCGIGEEGARMLSNALSRNHTLARLSLRCNRIGDKGFHYLCTAILTSEYSEETQQQREASGLISLNVGSNGITDKGLHNMPSILQLEELHLDENDISDRGALDLAKAVIGNTSLKWLNLAANAKLSWKGKETLKMFLNKAQVLETNCHLSRPHC